MQKYLCNPALLYVIFASVQIIFDLFNEMWSLAITKTFVAIIFTFILNMLCVNGLSVISWFLILIPFFLTLLLVEILIFILGVKDETTETALENESTETKTKTKTKTKTINNNNNKKQMQFIDISYAESPHVDNTHDLDIEQIQIDDFHHLDINS